MNLVVDIGNTRIKLALFQGEVLKNIYYYSLEEGEAIREFAADTEVKRAIVSSVVENAAAIIDGLKKTIPFVISFDHQTKIPVKNLYKTPQTLGPDRIPPIVAAHKLHPNANILVIDTGTCIKYNFLNSSAEYLGGGISPGLKMRFKALHTFTSRLPLIEPDNEFNALVGTDSRESILSGVQTAAVAELTEMIKQYKTQYPKLKVFLTGGDHAFFEKRLKNAIFVDPDLVLKGLNLILNFNA